MQYSQTQNMQITLSQVNASSQQQGPQQAQVIQSHHLMDSFHCGFKNGIDIGGPAREGGGGERGFHVARLNFKTSHACGCLSMLVAYCQLCRHCRNLAEGGCLLSRFHFTRCRCFLGHVACQNLPWQALIIYCSCIYVVIANLKFSSL